MNGVNIEAALARYRARVRQFDTIAARRAPATREPAASWPEYRQPPSRREVKVLRLIAEGLSNKEIGAELVITEDTVKTHVRNLLVKLKARNRAHAVAIGYDQGLIQSGGPAVSGLRRAA